MRRSGPLVRRTALRATETTNRSSPLRRTPLAARSARQAKREQEWRTIRAAVILRDGRRCVLDGSRATPRPHRCLGGLEAHHLRKRSASGRDEEANLVTLCSFANALVENEPAWAKSVGLVVNSAISPTEARARRLAHGITRGPVLGNNGG